MTDVAESTIELSADDLLTIYYPQAVATSDIQRLATALRKQGWREVVSGLNELTIQFDSATELPQQAKARLIDWLEQHQTQALLTSSAAQPTIEIPVCYEPGYALDLEWLNERLGISAARLMQLHTAQELTVQLIGYLPGFAYCGTNNADLEIERLTNPRERVAAGSVGIANRQTGIYTLPGPGGWPIIGRTPIELFHTDRQQPAVLLPGHRVRFYAISSDEFEQLSGAPL